MKLLSQITDNVTSHLDILTEDSILITGDSISVLAEIPSNSIDLIFADPPYFLSNGGVTNKSGRFVKVNKGEWDEGGTLSVKYEFNKQWLSECSRILKDEGTIWVSGTHHNIFVVGYVLEESGFSILNNVVWEKNNPPPNLSCRTFTHSTENIIWAKKRASKKYIFNYDEIKKKNYGKQVKDVWKGSLTPLREKVEGKHPTQKPIYLLEKIIESTTHIGGVVLDPFSGSGTTGVACRLLGRKYIGIDISQDYNNIARNRIQKTESYLF